MFCFCQVLEIISDLSKDNEAEKIVEETIKMFQNMDILINNAGTLSLSLISKVRRMQVNIFMHQATKWRTQILLLGIN